MVDNEKFKEDSYELSHKIYSWNNMKLFSYSYSTMMSFHVSQHHLNVVIPILYLIIYLKVIKNIGHFKGSVQLPSRNNCQYVLYNFIFM